MSGGRITWGTTFASFATLVIACVGMRNFGGATPDESTVFAMGFLGGMYAMRVWASDDERAKENGR